TIKNETKKKYALCLIGDKEDTVDSDQIVFAKSIQSSILKILKLSDPTAYQNTLEQFRKEIHDTISLAKELSNRLDEKQEYVRGFFAGGTLCYESIAILEQTIEREIHSNL